MLLAQIGSFVPAESARSAWWTASSRASAPATGWRAASRRSWSRCARPPRSSAHASRAQPDHPRRDRARHVAPSTGSRSRGRSPSICTTRPGSARARCSRPTTTSSPTSRARKRARRATRTSPRASGTTRWCSCAGSSRAARAARTASRWRGSRGLPGRGDPRARARCSRNLEGGELDARGRPRLAADAGDPRSSARSSRCSARAGGSARGSRAGALRALRPEETTPLEALAALARAGRRAAAWQEARS